MSVFLRSVLMLLMLATLLGVSTYGASAALTAEIAAAADPCCEGDCPDDPACGASCAIMIRCGTANGVLPQSEEVRTLPGITVTALQPDDPSQPSGRSPDGLRRPPRI
jgi:hypothetical protein